MQPRRYGLRRHYRIAPWTDFVEVHWSRHGEAYVTPVGDNLVGVAVLSRDRRSLRRAPDGVSRPRRCCSGAGGRIRYAAPGRCGSGRGAQRAGRALLVGDAAGYVDALTGEGIALAMATAAAAVRCLAADRPQAYPAQWARLTRRHRLLTEGLLRAARYPGTARLIVPAAHRAPAAFRAAVHALQ